MSKLFSRATVSGASLTGAALKAALTALWDAMNTAGFSDANRTTVTTTSTLLTTQCGLLLVDATSASITLTLPASGTAADDALYMLRRIDSTANTVTVQRAGADTVEGGTSITLPPNSTTELQIPGGSANWRVIGIGGPTSLASRDALGLAQSGGQCRLAKSGANLLLSPLNGNCIVINGAIQHVPSAGVSLAPTSLTPSTTYNIYAYMVGTVMTLEASTTAHSTDATTGVEIKTGDATRSLVGMARIVTGPAWQDAVNQRFVISWFSRRGIPIVAAFTAARSLAPAGYAEINTEIRNEFLTWATDAVAMSFDGSVSNASVNGNVNTSMALDGAASSLEGWSRFQAYANAAVGPASLSTTFTTTEGYHYVTVFGSSTIGNGTWDFLAGAAGNRCTLKGLING